jgi:hypothetical protein
MSKDVLYCGDASLASGAAYLAGLMTRAGISFDYVPMDTSMPAGRLDGGYRLLLLSDYPSRNLPAWAVRRIIELVKGGASLLMIGGWESFHGLLGLYNDSELAALLPVACLERDDRHNCCQGLIPQVTTPHPIVEGLPWDEPPVICGYNEVTVKTGSTLVLGMRKVLIRGGQASLSDEQLPLLAVGAYGKGRTGAFTTDLAPHWVGGMVDWGTGRVKAQAPGGNAIEVGSAYASFIEKLLRWFL